MELLYWITRLNGISDVSVFISILAGVLTLILLIVYYISNGQMIYNKSHGYETSYEEMKGYRETCLKSLKISVSVFIIFISAFLFIPNTKEALLIYGVGGTVDYLKENPTAKKLPDKCINALDKWVDSWTNDSLKIK